MRSLTRFGLYFTLSLSCLYPSAACPAAAAPTPVVPQVRKPAAATVTAAYENTTLTEDVSWRGTVVVKGTLVVASQATLRIEPGTVVRFLPSRESRQLPRMVVLGRIHAAGTLDRPVSFASGASTPARSGEWGGILLLSSEKRNQLEHCRIEGAETALEGRFSNISAKSLTVASAGTGLLLRDCNATITYSIFSGCQTGIEAHDSELDLRESTVAQNRKGLALTRTSALLSTVTVTGNRHSGLGAEECRLKISSCELTGNGIGAQVTGGEGQIVLTRFNRNLEAGLQLSGARLRVTRCQFSDNLRDGVRLEDARATLWGNVFSGNGNYNLVNAGRESVSAVQNWWGAADEASVLSKIMDAARDPRYGFVSVFPWLTERPAVLP